MKLGLPDGIVGRFNKYLYGLKQAGLEWYNNLSSAMTTHGYKISRSDPCQFTKRKKNGHCLITGLTLMIYILYHLKII
jgi:hypothetical protein